MNKSILVGRICKDIELKLTPNGVSVCSFTVAINRRFQKDTTDFINVVAWKQTAEFINKYFSKGSMIGLVGSIQTRTYDGKNGKVYVTEVNAEEAYFTGDKAKTEADPISNIPAFVETDFVPGEMEDDLPF